MGRWQTELTDENETEMASKLGKELIKSFSADVVKSAFYLFKRRIRAKTFFAKKFLKVFFTIFLL